MPCGDGRRQEGGSRGESARIDRTVDLPSSRRRRTLLEVLGEADHDHTECSELATVIVEREGREYTLDRDLVLIHLHHRQLPVLEEAGVVEYDHRERVVHVVGDDESTALSHTRTGATSSSSQ